VDANAIADDGPRRRLARRPCAGWHWRSQFHFLPGAFGSGWSASSAVSPAEGFLAPTASDTHSGSIAKLARAFASQEDPRAHNSCQELLEVVGPYLRQDADQCPACSRSLRDLAALRGSSWRRI